MIYIYFFFIAAGFVFIAMPAFIKLMHKHKVLDKSGGRKIHKGEKVNMGGIVIFFGFLCVYIIAIPIFLRHESIDLILTFILLLSIVVVVGIRDDMNSLSPITKLVIEIIIGIFFCKMGIKIDNLYGLYGFYEIPIWLSYIVTIAFVIIITNAYNLIDGVDGQSASQAILTLFLLFLFFYFLVPQGINSVFGNIEFWSIVSISLIGALSAYLYYNWYPSRVFMGDTGSMTIGVILSCVMIIAIQYNGSFGEDIKLFGNPIKSKIGVIVMLFYLPLVDTLRVFIARVMKGRSPLYPDKSHIHHFILRTSGTHQEATLTSFLFSLCFSMIGIFLSFYLRDDYFIPFMILLFFLYVLLLKIYTKYRMRYKTKKLRISYYDRTKN